MTKKVVTVEVTGMEPDKPNINGRVYPEETLKKAFKKYQEKVDKGEAFIYMSSSPKPSLKDAGAAIKDISLTPKGITLDLELLPTDKGELLEQLHKKGFVEFTSVGYGSVKDGKVQKDYSILHFSATPIPAEPKRKT